MGSGVGCVCGVCVWGVCVCVWGVCVCVCGVCVCVCVVCVCVWVGVGGGERHRFMRDESSINGE